MEILLKVLPWIAVICLPLGYWKQIFHILKHKEVRDLDLSSYIFFLFTYLCLIIESVAIDSKLFIWKNILAMIPTGIIIFLIVKNKDKKWVDDTYEKMREKQSCKKVQLMHKNINMRQRNSEIA